MSIKLKLDKITKINVIISTILCLLFIIGIVITGVSYFIHSNENEYFWNVATKYNAIVIILSLIPIAPTLLIINIVNNISKKHSFGQYH